MRVTIDKQSCLSSGRCVQAEPEIFSLDDDHLGQVKPTADLTRERLLAAARDCPGLAITVYDDDGREIGPN
jgi:ferredoxin